MARFPTRSPARSRARRQLVTCFSTCLLVSGCCGCGDGDLAAVYALPDTIRVAVPTAGANVPAPGFEAYVQLLHEDDGILPEHLRDEEGYELPVSGKFEAHWEWVGQTAGTLNAAAPLVASGRRVKVPAAAVTAPIVGHLEVTVTEDDCHPKKDVIVVRYEVVSAVEDVVVVDGVGGDGLGSTEGPTIAVLEGERAATPVGFEGVAVVSGASVGKLQGTPSNPSRASFFRERHGAELDLDAFTGANDVVQMPATSVPRNINVAIWIAAPDDPSHTLLEEALHEARIADTVFARNRVGMRLNPVHVDGGKYIQPVSINEPGSLSKDYACERGGPSSQPCVSGSGTQPCVRNAVDLFKPLQPGGAAPDFSQEETLNVLYVGYLTDPPGTTIDLHGLWCGNEPDKAGLVLINISSSAPTTLAHEVGHALDQLHTQGVPELSDWKHSNFMVDYHLPDPWARSLDHVTLGQSYGMNVSSQSWPNYALPIPPVFVRYCIYSSIPFGSGVIAPTCPPPGWGVRKFQ